MLQDALAKFAGQKLIRDKYENYINGTWAPPARGISTTSHP